MAAPLEWTKGLFHEAAVSEPRRHINTWKTGASPQIDILGLFMRRNDCLNTPPRSMRTRHARSSKPNRDLSWRETSL